jgi:hypothetical protein
MSEPRDLVEALRESREEHKLKRGSCICTLAWPCPTAEAIDVAIVLGEGWERIEKYAVDLHGNWSIYDGDFQNMKEALTAAQAKWDQK